jgi:hypothetical protein
MRLTLARVLASSPQVFSNEFFSALAPACTNVPGAFCMGRVAVTTLMEAGVDDFGNAAVVQKYDLEDPLDRSTVHSSFPHRSKRTGALRILAVV